MGLKIVLISQDAPLYLASFLDDFFTRLAQTQHRIEGVVLLSPLFKGSLTSELKRRLNYYGPVDFCRMTAAILWNKILAMLGRRHSVEGVLGKHQLARWMVDDINGGAFISHLKSDGVDVVLSIAAPRIFKTPLLKAPRLGCINYHTALLPKYRGRQPLFWALLNSEPQVGISIHEMDEKLDNGPILVQQPIPVSPDDSLDDLYRKTIRVGPGLIVDALNKLDAGDTRRLPNEEAQATLHGFPTKNDAQKFRASRKRFF